MNVIAMLSLPVLLMLTVAMLVWVMRAPRAGPGAGSVVDPGAEPDLVDDPVIRGTIAMVRGLLLLAVFGGTFGFVLYKGL